MIVTVSFRATKTAEPQNGLSKIQSQISANGNVEAWCIINAEMWKWAEINSYIYVWVYKALCNTFNAVIGIYKATHGPAVNK